MKSNKERVDEVFRRAEHYDDIQKKEKDIRVKFWVKWVSCALTAVILVCSIIGIVTALLGSYSEFNLDKMYIANFENYQAIGVGGDDTIAEEVLSSSSSSSQSYSVSNSTKLQASAASNSTKKSCLVGVKENDEIEKCEVVSKKGDKPKQIPSSKLLSAFRALKNFTFIEFLTRNPANNSPYNFEVSDGSLNGFRVYKAVSVYDYDRETYIIDNKTGKFYSLNSVLPNDTRIYFDFKWGYGRDDFFDLIESENSVIVFIKKDSKDDGIYKIYIKNDELVLEKILDLSDKNYVPNYQDAIVDKFGNVYLLNDYATFINGEQSNMPYNNTYKVNYIIGSDGKIKPCSESIKISLNGLCYIADGSKYFDENGELADGELDKVYYFESRYKIKTEENVDYYFVGDDKYNQGLPNAIYKITWEPDGVNYTVSTISIDGKNFGYVTTKDYIYTINVALTRIEITTGNATPVNEEYSFSTIEADNLGNVLFRGLDEVGNKVIGIINNKGEITVLTKPREYQIYYIKPVNQHR